MCSQIYSVYTNLFRWRFKLLRGVWLWWDAACKKVTEFEKHFSEHFIYNRRNSGENVIKNISSFRILHKRWQRCFLSYGKNDGFTRMEKSVVWKECRMERMMGLLHLQRFWQLLRISGSLVKITQYFFHHSRTVV